MVRLLPQPPLQQRPAGIFLHLTFTCSCCRLQRLRLQQLGFLSLRQLHFLLLRQLHFLLLPQLHFLLLPLALFTHFTEITGRHLCPCCPCCPC